jgi:hypothetical protein
MKELEPSPSLGMSFSQRFDGTMKRAEEVAQKRIEAYVCDRSAVEAIEARPELLEHLDGPSFMSSFPQTTSATNRLGWEVWKPFEDADLACPAFIEMVLWMTDTESEVAADRSLYESVAAMLQVHSHSPHDLPRHARCLVTNNRRFWELYLSSENKREDFTWAIQRVGGGRRLVAVKPLWELVGEIQGEGSREVGTNSPLETQGGTRWDAKEVVSECALQ